MPITRRQTIIGLGLLASGSGINTVSAFSNVDSSRGVSFGFADDSNAYLQMQAARDAEYLTVEDRGNGITIEINGVNQDARSRLDNLLQFTNNGSNTVTELRFDIDDRSDNAVLQLGTEAIENVQLGPGESVTGLDLIVDTTQTSGNAELNATITITAETNA